MIGFVAVDGILRQGALAPGVYTTHSMHVEVDVEIDKTAPLDLIRMTGWFKVFLTIVPSTDAEGLESTDS